MSDDLVQWYSEQLNEDERIARAATPGPWKQNPKRVGSLESADYWYVVDCSDGHPAGENAEHVAAWDPARVLSEIDAKRQLLEALLGEAHAVLRPGGSTEIYCAADYEAGEPCECGRDERVDRSIRILAAAYNGRPGYREEWRP